jgi:hypothetical protein
MQALTYPLKYNLVNKWVRSTIKASTSGTLPAKNNKDHNSFVESIDNKYSKEVRTYSDEARFKAICSEGLRMKTRAISNDL